MIMNINKPIFVIGTNRAGKELFIKLIAYHKELGWLSNYHMRFPTKESVAYLNRLLDFPLLYYTKIKYMKGIPKPSSSYMFWNNIFEGFRRPFRDLREDDVNPLVEKKIRQKVYNVLKKEGKKRFLAQYSGWSRIGFFKKIYPDAKFIHIVRDGRAVANSLTNYEGWEGWEGVYNWRLGYLPNEEEKNFLENVNWSFYGIAALEWKAVVSNIIEVSSKLSKDDFLTIRYEDLVSEPLETVFNIFDFCELEINRKQYLKHFKTIKIINANESKFRIPSWKQNLSVEIVAELNEFLYKELKYFSYLT